MERNNKSVIEVANMLRIHTNTIYKILRGQSVHHLTERAVDAFLAEHELTDRRAAKRAVKEPA